MTILAVGLFCLAPAFTFWLLGRALDKFSAYPGAGRRTDGGPDRDPHADLPRFGADLRRISAEHDRVVNSEQPGKALRLQALQLAYDDTLCRVGSVLELDLPDPPLPSVTRLQAEAELAAHGFVW